MVWICCASGRSLIASAMRWNSAGIGSSEIEMPTPIALR